MRPFDLEKALAGAKVVTRDGREVTQLTKFDTCRDWCLIGLLDGDFRSYDVNGKYKRNEESDKDLFMAHEKQSIWVNVYSSEKGKLFCLTYYSKQEANKSQSSANFIKTIEITNEPKTETKDLHWATVMIARTGWTASHTYKIAFESEKEFHKFLNNIGTMKEITITTIEP